MAEDGEVNIKTSVSLIPENYNRMRELVLEKKYPSNAAVINAAMTAFFAVRDYRDQHRIPIEEPKPEIDITDLVKAFEAFVKSPAGKMLLEKSITKDADEEITRPKETIRYIKL